MSAAPFFIIGSGRSGTTLLRMILASHSRLSIPAETYFLLPLLAELPVDRTLSPAQVDRAIAIITGHFRWPDMEIDSQAFSIAARALRQPCLRDVVEIVYAYHLAREGKQRWGDKTPAYIRIVPQLAAMYPGARLIHLVRDGRDVAKSFQSVGWYGPLLHKNMGEWREAMALDRRWRGTALSQQILVVRYEDLVRCTETVTRTICAFLGEAFEADMLDWSGRVERLVPRREIHIHQKLRRPPNTADVDRWQREMNGWEILVCEAFMGPDLARAGYERRFDGPAVGPLFAAVRLICSTVLPLWSRLSRRFATALPVRQSGVKA